jgi:hypothetical protein
MVSTNNFLPHAEPAGNSGAERLAISERQPSAVSQDANGFWQLFVAILTWVSSVALLLLMPLLFAGPYVIYKGSTVPGLRAESLLTNKTFVLLSLLAVIPAHILTIVIVWAVVTGLGKRAFWETLKWSWPERFGPWKTVALAVVLLGLGLVLSAAFGGSETQLDQLINSSYAARLTTAFLAAATAPLAEELVYRGVLYSAFERVTGAICAVIIVSTMFAGVHIYQYYNNFGVIAVIALLSISLTLVRALTGRLLPCFVMHLVFNGIQSIFLVIQPYVDKIQHVDKQTPAAIHLIAVIGPHLG